MANKQAELARIEPEKKSLVELMAERYGMLPQEFKATLRSTCFPNVSNVTDEQVMMFLAVAHEYELNPFTREVYAFPRPGGGIQTIVSVDGWMKLINKNPAFDGMKFEDVHQGKELISITCRMYRKDRREPVEATEYMAECKRNTDPWRQWPRRMLRHKAAIQAARYAFGFAGIVEPDEAERAIDRPVTVVVDTPISAIADTLPDHEPHVDTDSGGGNAAPASPDPDQPIGNDGGQELQDSADRLGLTIKQQMTLLKKYNITGYDELPLGKMEEFIKDMQILNVMGSKQ